MIANFRGAFKTGIPPAPPVYFDGDINDNDRLLTTAIWEFGATSVKVTFTHISPGLNYYVLWCADGRFRENVHRSWPIIPEPDVNVGDSIERALISFTPESTWYFQVVSNPDLIKGEQ